MNLQSAGALTVSSDTEGSFPIGTKIRFEQAGPGRLEITKLAGTIATVAVRDSSLYVNSSAVTGLQLTIRLFA